MRAKIFSPAKTSTQSGRAKSNLWMLQYEPQTKRQPESLMGWVSSEDTVGQIRMKFKTKDEAVNYATRQGLEFDVIEPHKRKVIPRNYLQNFKI